ncbi:hypothetical protein ACRYCC_35875 [Actinomadura scrupuli]|uniref:hypothetical protein n=1 Tax=Actinomadura scrupuli TaxID=559629 RepID=UPI003D98BC3A
MERIVRGAALLAIGSVVMTGCAADGPSRESQAAALAAAVLSLQDMPRGFLPAQDQRVFGGLSPRDPDCHRLLALADLDDLRDRSALGSPVPPQAHAVFYRAEPGSTMAEHLITLSPDQARGRFEDVRRAAAGCPLIELGSVRGPRQGRPPGHGRKRDQGRGSQLDPGRRRSLWYRYRPWRGGLPPGRPGSGGRGHGHGGHGHDRYERDGYERDAYGRDGYGRDAYGHDGYGRDGYGHDGYGRDGYGRDRYGRDGYGREHDEHRPAPGGAKRGRSGYDEPAPGGTRSGQPGRGRSGPAGPRTGRGEYGSVPDESGRVPHGHGRFGLGFGLGAGQGHGGRAYRPGLLLHRLPMALPGLGPNVYGVRYSGRAGRRYQVHFDLVVAELGGRLLVMEQPVLIDRRRTGGDSILRIVTAALHKLRETAAVPGPEPLIHPSAAPS